MKVAIWGCVLCLMTSCQQGWLFSSTAREKAAQPSVTVPPHWQSGGAKVSGEVRAWLGEWRDPALMTLVNEALANNHNLKATAARLQATAESPIVARAARLPRAGVTAAGSGTVSELNGSERYALQFSTSWEWDLWGKWRDQEQAALAELDAANADWRATQMSLVALTVKAYANVIAARQQSLLASETLASFEKNLRIIERNYKAGVPGVRALDVQLGRNNVSSAQRGVSARGLEQHQAARALELLLGRYPAAAFATAAELPAVDAKVPRGVPAQLLERRSDLRAARARLLAASKRIDAADKQLLPNVTLNLGAGVSGAAFAVLGNAQQLVASVGANLAQNFDLAGNVRAEQRAAQARYQATLEDYAQACLSALREVESAIDTEQSLQQQEVFLRKEVEQAALAQRQAERDYSQGLDGADILSVLESQRRANSASAALIRLRNDRVQARVDLHLALGGDFR